MSDLVAHKVKVHLNNKQASWIKDHCIASRLAYNFAVERLRNPVMDYEACLDAADEPARFSSRIDGAIQPARLDFKKVKFPSAFDVSKLWTIERDRLHPWMKARGLNLDTISGVFSNNYAAALNQWKVAKWNKDKMPVFHGKGAKLSSTWRGRTLKQINQKTFALPGKHGTFRLGCPLRFDLRPSQCSCVDGSCARIHKDSVNKLNGVEEPCLSIIDKSCEKLNSGEIRSVTFSFDGGDWYASFLIKTELPKQEPAPAGTAVGIDVGVAQFASLSDGQQFPPGMDYDAELAKLAKIQRVQSRMQGPVRGKRKASNNWLKQNKKLQKHHQHIANKRRHYTEIITKQVAANYQTVAIEDLKIKNMTGSAKGDAETPGKNVAQKSGLNRSILNGGFYQFRNRLEAKVAARAGQVIAVNPAYTSQTCSACGHVAKENRLSQSAFQCVKCGHEANADLNAAQNILIRALCSDEKIVVPTRRKADCGHQGTSTPASLFTEPVAVLAQEADKQGVPISTAATQTVTQKRVKQVKQLDWLLQTAA